ncbi:MAG TPA: thioredoxin family protein [Archaeoglobus profundus]|nr:thioredoxin family protein [Archaeoglobus profundus]
MKKVVEKERLDADIEYVTDMSSVAKLGVLVTPAVWVDGEIVIQGKIPSESEILKFIKKK